MIWRCGLRGWDAVEWIVSEHPRIGQSDCCASDEVNLRPIKGQFRTI